MKFEQATGIKRWLLDKGLAAKQYYLEREGSTGHFIYDNLIFGKVS